MEKMLNAMAKEIMLAKLLDGELKPNSRENFQILMNAKKQWEMEYEKAKIFIENLIAKYNAENNCNFTFDDYIGTAKKIGEYITSGKKNTPEFSQFQNSKEAQFFNQVRSPLPRNNDKCYINLVNKLNLNPPDFNYVIETLKTIAANVIIPFEEKICTLSIFDAILEMTNGQLASQVIPLFTDIELNSNETLKKFDHLYRNNGTFEETFNLLQTYLNENKDLRQYITFFVHFNVLGKVLANEYPEHTKKCQALINKCSDVHKFSRGKYLRENIQPQQNNKPPMSTGPKEHEAK